MRCQTPSELGKLPRLALIGKGRQDPQSTHNPSAVGSSPTRPTMHPCDLRKRLIWGADSGRWSTGLNPLLVSSTPLPSALVEVALTCADVSAHGWRMASWVGCASVWTSNSGRWLDTRIRKCCPGTFEWAGLPGRRGTDAVRMACGPNWEAKTARTGNGPERTDRRGGSGRAARLPHIQPPVFLLIPFLPGQRRLPLRRDVVRCPGPPSACCW